MTSVIKRPALEVARRPERFDSNDRRVITRYLNFGRAERIRSILDRIIPMDEAATDALLESVRADFSSRHLALEVTFRDHFARVAPFINTPEQLSEKKKALIGAFFTMEYSFESAALFNPSIVLHPDQTGVAEGEARFLLSMRATGEGHVSSIVFRRGVVDRSGHLEFNPPSKYAFTAQPVPDKKYEKRSFLLKLGEMGADVGVAAAMLIDLDDWFTMDELHRSVDSVCLVDTPPEVCDELREAMIWLAEANYALSFPTSARPSEMVIFPATDHESHGMEDLRLVRFTEDDGRVTYYGTYTAYDGHKTIPMLLETTDFHNFHISTLNGEYARNKGMALFPRTVGGRCLMVGRHDGESLYLMESDNLHFWNKARPLQAPVEPWELVQIGNCGSPVETELGWILLTHGVGPMRRYCIGAMLLDLRNPLKVIGRLRDPLIVPTDDEREGYVPNVVYSCGSMIHGENLIIPYAMSDIATRFASVKVRDLLEALVDDGP